ncbi:MAG: hypothetical protein QG657_3327 [Acidobacteriota bacterium]|nr:hypothetical protein [Acidobacteriota bacterium]
MSHDYLLTGAGDYGVGELYPSVSGLIMAVIKGKGRHAGLPLHRW